jgi:hypothetical protein
MSRIAHEVSRRLTPEYAKERAREMARDRMSSARDRAVENRWFAPLLGAGIGALLAKTLQSRAQERTWDRDDRFRYRRDFEARYGYGYPRGDSGYAAAGQEEFGAEAGMPPERFTGRSETGVEAGTGIGDKAADVKARARATADQVKGRIQEATSAVKQRVPDRQRIRQSTHEDAGLWAFGAMALGALFGFALPETQREREMLEPARRKARELGQQVKDKALEKGTEAMDQAREKVDELGGQGRVPGQPGATGGPSGEPPALH